MHWDFAKRAFEQLTGVPPVAGEQAVREYALGEAFELDAQTQTPYHRLTNGSEFDRERLRDLIDVSNALGYNLTRPDRGGWE